MQKYPVKASHRANLNVDVLESLGRTHFGTAERTSAGVVTQYGAISNLTARPEGRELAVELTMNPKVDEAVARETILRYNRFLEDVTGFNAKERARKLRKSAGA